MRWETLFEDLESQYEAAARAADDELVVELAEAEVGSVALADRLRASVGRDLTVRLRTGEELRGRLLDCAPQWLLLGTGDGRDVVPTTAIVAAWPLGRSAPEATVAERRLRVNHVLRGLAREGVRVRLRTDGATWSGWLVRVGADHVDVHLDQPQGGAGTDVISVALSALLTVSRP